MSEFTNAEERREAAQAEYERIMTTPGPGPMGAFIETGVIGFVFGEMWRRGVLSARDRRLITLCCVGVADTVTPIETHVWAALNSGDLSYEEYDEFVLHFGTQVGWPKASMMSMHGMTALFRLAEEQGLELEETDFEWWADPVDDATRRRRGEEAYEAVLGAPSPPAPTAFRGRSYLDFLYGEVWTRTKHLTRRDRRIITICSAAAVGVDEEVDEHVRAALAMGDLDFEELQELVVHYAIYLGWPLGRRLDDIVVGIAREQGMIE